ncbi:MAG: type VI secretion system baseplate subunit TssK [Bryobacteraceae bacterium]
MRIEPVVWSKGTFLNPQHLQAHDRYLEALLHFKLDALAFRPWGFLSYAIDRHQLAGGSIQVTEASGIFADGLPFDFPYSDISPPPRSLKDSFAPDQDSLDVFLGIPAYQAGGVNVVNSQLSVDARFRSEFAMIRDENTGTSEKSVPIARKNLRILVGHEGLRQGTVLRLARVLRGKAGVLELDPEFVAPVIDFRASDFLKSITREIVSLLAARGREIPVNLRHFTSSEILDFWLLHTINSHLPVLRDFYEKRSAHPEALFNEMLKLAAELTTFSSTTTPADLPTYDHDEIGPRFAALRETIRLLVRTAIPRNYVALALRQSKPAIFTTPLEDPKYIAERARMYFAVHTNLKKAEVIQKAPDLIKLWSGSEIDYIVRQQLPGLKFSYTEAPLGFSAPKPDYQYFAIEQSGVGWETICRARSFGAFVPDEFPQVELELIVVLPES